MDRVRSRGPSTSPAVVNQRYVALILPQLVLRVGVGMLEEPLHPNEFHVTTFRVAGAVRVMMSPPGDPTVWNRSIRVNVMVTGVQQPAQNGWFSVSALFRKSSVNTPAWYC